MAQLLHWEQRGGALVLSGEMDHYSLLPLWEARDSAVSGCQSIDLHALERIDTAGVALLIHLVDAIQRQSSGPATIVGASEKLRTLSQLYNLQEALLPFSAV